MYIYGPRNEGRKQPVGDLNEDNDSAELKNALTLWDSLQEKESLRAEEIRASIVTDPTMKEINSKIEEINTVVIKNLEALTMLRSSRQNLESELREKKEKEIPSNLLEITNLKSKIQILRRNSERRRRERKIPNNDGLFYTDDIQSGFIETMKRQYANTLKDSEIYKYDGSKLQKLSTHTDEEGNITFDDQI